MKNLFVLFTLIGTIIAVPADFHRRHGNHGGQNTAVAAQTSTATPVATPAAQQATNPNGQQGDHRNHRHGNQGNNPTAANAAASTKPGKTTTARAGNQSTAVASNGNNVNPGSNANAEKNGNNANNGNANNGNANRGGVNPAQVPDFGQRAGLQPDGTGNCKSDVGKTIPCQCPPNRAAFIAKLNEFVAAGSFFGKLAAPFPSGNSNQEALTRINTIISTLQNFNGRPGVGCPSVSAPNFSVVQQRLIKGG